MTNRYRPGTRALEVIMILAGVAFVSPLYILVNVAVKGDGDMTNPLAPARRPSLDNFVEAWNGAHLGNALINTTVIVVLSLALLVVAASLAGYTIARRTSLWSRAAFVAFLLGLLLPFQLATIPLYQLMQQFGLLGTIWGLVLFYAATLMPFSVFLYASFIRALPIQFEEAAEVDGASPVRVFFSVVFPMMRAVTGTVVILNTINIWNDFFTPRLYLSGSGTETVTVSLYSYVGQYGTQWNLIFGGLIIASLPILAAFFVLQKHVIKGFAGGLKG
ncbi:carbohydrate ABC transporter permease [Nonomuraea sp. NPDC005650]|uniref:carbohydrate ABC transporter permease n=1 Tax=Nonomuraea sp. NPDC005650 TaxID=3157045 RepID=UPI0033B684A6